MTSNNAESNKKIWQRPTLQTYGTIGVMTSAVDNMGMMDGGGMGANRT